MQFCSTADIIRSVVAPSFEAMDAKDVADVSTAVPGSNAASDGESSDGLTTHKTRETSSRPSNQRGPKRRNKKKTGYLEHCKQLALAAGREWVDDIHTKDSSTNGTQMTEAIQSEAGQSKVDMLALLFGMPDELPTIKNVTVLDAVQRAVVRTNPCGDWCMLCNKHATWDHTHSRNHMKLVNIQAQMNMWMGMPARGFRPYAEGCPPDEFNLLTDEKFSEFWGDGVSAVTGKLKEKIKVTGFNMKRSNSAKTRREDHTAIQGMVPALINYVAGQGKYSSKQRLIFHHELPLQCQPGEQWWPVQVLSLRPDKKTEYAVDDSEDPPDHGKFDKLIEGDGKKTDDMAVNDLTELLRQGLVVHNRSRTKCWVICGYQWMDDVPDAWPVSIRSRM